MSNIAAATYTCKICDKEILVRGFGSHLMSHNICAKDYYDLYLKKDGEGICLVCGNDTPFMKISKGYQKHCSIKCSQSNPETQAKMSATRLEMYGVTNFFQNKDILTKAEQNAHTKASYEKRRCTSLQNYGVENPMHSKEVINKIQTTNLEKYGSRAYNRVKGKITMKEKYGYEHALQVPKLYDKLFNTIYKSQTQYEIKNDCTRLKTLLSLYGSGWYQHHILDIITYKGNSYIHNSNIDKIIKYNNECHSYCSHTEKELVDFIKTIYNNSILENDRTIIKPLELDIYLPELKLAIEYNGSYWHSVEMRTPIDYHLQKSLLCRAKGIRLIHIYEFEDFDVQKQLLKDLILGVDNYHKNDFNKNNLIINIPEPSIIYDNKESRTIYGAGQLY